MSQKLIESEKWFSTTLQSIGDAVIATDATLRIKFMNPVAEKLTGWTIEAAADKALDEVFRIINENNRQSTGNSARNVLEQGVIVGLANHSLLINKSGVEIPIDNSAAPIKEKNGEVTGVVLVFRDITERKRMEARLNFLYRHDPLTGIYNRAFFEEKLQELQTELQPPVGIVICDLDGLKLVNDTLGHQRGDEMLIFTGKAIAEAIGPHDLAARIGGDEFAILMPGSDQETVEATCRKIRNVIEADNRRQNGIPLSVSFGCAIYNSPTENISRLFKEADDNMYREKLCRSQNIRNVIIQAIMKVLENKDYINEGHARRSEELACALAASLKLSDSELVKLRLLARFHDIGKVGVSDQILFKNGQLNSEERAEVQRHSEVGHRIANVIPKLLTISNGILKHHEWWDGSGYPLGLKELDIPLESRIMALVDAYDIMTHDRPYRKALSHSEAVAEIRRCAGTQFDPQLVEAFVAVLAARQRESEFVTDGLKK
jgi:diguanylate cyclase (GGDEF)-like protein/PAS domain S-box-containing protein